MGKREKVRPPFVLQSTFSQKPRNRVSWRSDVSKYTISPTNILDSQESLPLGGVQAIIMHESRNSILLAHGQAADQCWWILRTSVISSTVCMTAIVFPYLLNIVRGQVSYSNSGNMQYAGAYHTVSYSKKLPRVQDSSYDRTERLTAAKSPPSLKFKKPPVRKSQMNYLFIRKHFIYSVKDSNAHLFYHFRRNIQFLGMHFIDSSEEGLVKFCMHSLPFLLSVWIDEAFAISM